MLEKSEKSLREDDLNSGLATTSLLETLVKSDLSDSVRHNDGPE
jgi:hypothetical protein